VRPGGKVKYRFAMIIIAAFLNVLARAEAGHCLAKSDQSLLASEEQCRKDIICGEGEVPKVDGN